MSDVPGPDRNNYPKIDRLTASVFAAIEIGPKKKEKTGNKRVI